MDENGKLHNFQRKFKKTSLVREPNQKQTRVRILDSDSGSNEVLEGAGLEISCPVSKGGDRKREDFEGK